jgi:hypothetical protein
MAITWRPIVKSDIEELFSLSSSACGDTLVGRDAAIRIWGELTGCPFFLSALYEAAPPIHAHRVIGFAAAIFVSAEFAE